MRVSSGFRQFVLDQLADVPALSARAMFGGVGLYAHRLFFGILAADVLYLKVDEGNRPDYEAAGSAPFKPYADRPMTMSYYNVPVAVLEDATTLCQWAARSIGAVRGAGGGHSSGRRKHARAPRVKRPKSPAHSSGRAKRR